MGCPLTLEKKQTKQGKAVNAAKIPTKEEYKALAFINAFMEDAGRMLERVPVPTLGKEGNSKIHATGTKALTLIYSGLAWHDCFPTVGCNKCYAMGFRYLSNAAKRRGKAWLYSFMSRNSIEHLEFIIKGEIQEKIVKARRLGLLLAVRIHEAGDFISPEHVEMWNRIVKYFASENVVFWAYTRSDKASEQLRDSIIEFSKNDNVYIRASFDPMPDTALVGIDKKTIHTETMYRNGMPGAIIVGRKARGKLYGPARVAGAVNCPEQITNGEIGCADCGLCWNKSKPVIRFYAHL